MGPGPDDSVGFTWREHGIYVHLYLLHDGTVEGFYEHLSTGETRYEEGANAEALVHLLSVR